MARVSKDTASQVEAADGFEGHYTDTHGYTVGFESYSADQDLSPLFVGLPDNACQCPHWGYVIAGRLDFHYTDGTTDHIRTGEAYYAHPGHTPVLYAGTEVVEFSPADELAKTIAVVMGNISAMETSS
jgi:hypothetical protein